MHNDKSIQFIDPFAKKASAGIVVKKAKGNTNVNTNRNVAG